MGKSVKKKIIWLVAGLILLELLLRIGGFAYLTLKEHQNQPTEKDTYTILCLGESTTADGGINSWPAQLEKILNEKSHGKRFEVINEGIQGADTAFIFSKLQNNLKKYNPHVVITMMGVNDAELLLHHKDENALVVLYKNIKVFKLANLIWTALKGQKNTNNKQDYIALGRFYNDQKQMPEEAEKMFKKAIELNPNSADGYIGLGQCYEQQSKLEEAEKMFERAIEIDSTNILLRLELQSIRSYKEKGRPPEVPKDTLFSKATENNYNLLYQKLNNEGIKLVAMQYPTRSIEELKSMFQGNEDITFVSNEENFEQALQNGKYEDYFIDRCYGSFGHATPKGNQLIAENLANTILKEIGMNNQT